MNEASDGGLRCGAGVRGGSRRAPPRSPFAATQAMSATTPSPDTAAAATRPGRYRWRVCALLLAATTINYVDRQVLGVLAPFLQDEIGWSEIEYGYIVTSFQAAYAIGLLCAGAIVDRFGTRIGYALAISVWSLAAMAHALAGSVIGFAIARFALGLGEAGNFPAAVKTVAEWFPRRERALAVGIFNAGSNIGAILAPLLVPVIAVTWGWRAAFLFTGVLSASWLAAWLLTYRTPEQQPKLSSAELAHIRSDPPETTAKLPWLQLLHYRQAWAFVAAKFITDPVWWLFLFWLGKFLASEYGLSLATIGPPMIVVYLMADVGSVAGGWLAGRFIRLGWDVNRARKGAMLACALCVAPVVFVTQLDNLWLAVGLIGLAMAGHQGWSANVFTLPSDMFPRHAVASVVGIGGFAGAVGGMAMSLFTGAQLQSTGSYTRVFLIAGAAYLVALLVVHLLVPRLQPARLEAAPTG
jgi:ACS family hexuronate transporter-like MFS transporter